MFLCLCFSLQKSELKLSKVRNIPDCTVYALQLLYRLNRFRVIRNENLVIFFLGHSVYMSHVVRKPIFGVSDQVLHNPGCTAIDDGSMLEISDLDRRRIVLSMLRKQRR